MAKLGTVNVYWRTLDIHGHTGEILEVSRTSETYVSGNTHVHGGQINSQTKHYQQLFIRQADGKERNLEFEARVGFRAGQTATFVLATPHGSDTGRYVAVYNNTTGEINTIRRNNNIMACIPFWNWLMVLAVIIAVISLGGSGLLHWVWFLASVSYIIWVMRCQKKLMAGVAEIMKSNNSPPASTVVDRQTAPQ